MWPLDSSAHRRPAIANLAWLVFVCALGESAPAQELDLEGSNLTVTSLSGGGIITNSGPGSAILTNQGASSSFSGVIEDGTSLPIPAIGLTQDSTVGGTLTLTGANTYTGGTTISAGTLQIGNGGTTGSIVGGVADNGTLAFDRSDNMNFGGVISGTGSLTVLGNGTLTLTGANTYTGTTRVQAGTLMGDAANVFSANSPTTVISGGTLDLGGFNQTVTSLAGGGTVTNSGPGSAILTNQGASSFFTGDINGPVGLIQNSPGNTLTLSGNNTYSGETIVAAGTLNASTDFTFSARSPTTVNAGGTLDLGAQPQQIDNLNLAGGEIQDGPLTSLHGIISDGGKVDGIGGTTGLVANSGLTTLNTTTGSNTYTGATMVFASLTGSATNAFSASSPTTVNSGGTLDLGGLHQTINSVTLAGGVIRNGMLTRLGRNHLERRRGRRDRRHDRPHREQRRDDAEDDDRRQHI